MFQNLAVGAVCAFTAGQYLDLQTGLNPRSQFFVIFILATIVSSFITSTITSISHRNKARRLGCKPPYVRSSWVPLGLDMVNRMTKADKRNEVPEEFQKVHREIGHDTWKQSFFGSPQIFTVEPKNVQAVLATQFNDFEIGRLRRDNFFPLLGNGIFTSDGKSWEHSRAMLRPQFVRDQVADLDLEEVHVQNMFNHLATNAQGWTPEINLGPLFFRLTLDSATEFLFGQSVMSQVAALPDGSEEKINFEKRGALEWDQMATCFDSATHHLGHRSRYGEAYWIHSPKAFYDDCKEVHRFADFYTNKALSLDLSKLHDDEKSTNGKPKYVFLNELVKATRDPTEIRSQLLNILLAGRDTTAGLLGWTFWLLVRHPAVLEKLRKTILESFGTYDNPQNITFATLKACTYLQHVMNETLRLYPSVPINARRSIRDTTIPLGGGPDGKSPLFVPKGIEVVYSVHVMHRRKDLWGADADSFRPERWTSRRGGWEYLPFNGGPRICLGQQFALTEAGYVLVRMLQRFDLVENMDPSDVPKHQYSVTTAPFAVKVRLHEAR